MNDNQPTADAPPAPAMPTPDPALRRFDRFIGRWQMRGRTAGSNVAYDVSGSRITD